jgi:hypothetical protein
MHVSGSQLTNCARCSVARLDPFAPLRQALAARQTFFQDLQALTRYLLFESWDPLLDFMLQGLEIASPPDAS